MITLTSIAYEGNFRKLLSEDSWFVSFKSNFLVKKVLNVNNINSIEEFNELLSKIKGISVVYVDEYLNTANEYFKINTDLETYGYNYTMPYFTIILNVDTEYILNVASDCQFEIKLLDSFLMESMEILNNDDDVIVTTIPWVHPPVNGEKPVGQLEQDAILNSKTNEKFFFSDVMSDQVFFSKIEKLKKCDFTKTDNLHPYPSYGGNSFELRLGNYFKINKKFRGIYKTDNQYYIHGKD